MFRRTASSVLAVSILLLLPLADCQTTSAGQQAIECCRHMPCNPANRAHDCCKKTTSAQILSVLPNVHVPASPAIAMVALVSPEVELAGRRGTIRPGFEPPQHSPPRLYIFYAHLLI